MTNDQFQIRHSLVIRNFPPALPEKTSTLLAMNEPPDHQPPKYTWPRYALGMVVLGIILAVIWMTFAVLKVKRERDLTPPASGQAH